jgi:AcrR family transcriptional regulator
VERASNLVVKQLKTPRPRRGSPEQTRERLIASAAALFNRFGYERTDSNRIARGAGYATGTFYKHFKDKREIFLAAYQKWVSAEWKAVEKELSAGGSPEEIARRLVSSAIDFHTRWRRFRASLQLLVFVDPAVRRYYRAQRRRQLETISKLRASRGGAPRPKEEDAIHLFTTERVFDAIANGEIQGLGLDCNAVIECMVGQVTAVLS